MVDIDAHIIQNYAKKNDILPDQFDKYGGVI